MRLDSSGNLLVGTTSAAVADIGADNLVVGPGTGNNGITIYSSNSGNANLNFADTDATTVGFIQYQHTGNSMNFRTNSAEAMRIDSSGNLLVGATTTSPFFDGRFCSFSATLPGVSGKTSGGAFMPAITAWNTETTGNNYFVDFATETTAISRGTITYNRAGGLVAYNTTSDYRAKDISGPVVDSGALIDSTPVYMGKMKDATQERPMFIAHEVPAYAHTGEKDAVDKDGKPVYQQMDASALIPVMWAELQSLRARVAQLESKS